MYGAIVALMLATAMFATIALVLRGRKRAALRHQRLPGQLSQAERRHLYRQLGIDPVALTRQRRPNVVWRDPGVIDRRRTKA